MTCRLPCLPFNPVCALSRRFDSLPVVCYILAQATKLERYVIGKRVRVEFM